MKPLMLMILDGFAIAPPSEYNAVSNADKPNLDRFFHTYPKTTLGSSGLAVGLPEGQMGNSEVGHTNMGAGRIVYQELTRISKSIADGEFYTNTPIVAAMQNCTKIGSALHLCGLVSNGGVHSHNTHLYALLEMAHQFGIGKVYVHALLDGRDVPPDSGRGFIEELETELDKYDNAKTATVSGRYFAMDRDNRWDRVEKAYNAIAFAEAPVYKSALEAVDASYKKEVFDEFVEPSTIGNYRGINADDSFIFFNFRPDRAREITRTFTDPKFECFVRREFIPLYYVCMTQYDATMPNVSVAFSPQSLSNTFGEYISACGLKQLRIAETEKYAHVTFFFNGGREEPYTNEDRILIPSPKVATYDLQPEMSAYEVTEAVLKKIDEDTYDVIILNFANCDMVGHTGIYEAAIKAVEAVDDCAGRVADKVLSKGGCVFLTSDHGNADCMADGSCAPFTAHTTNPVPLVLIGAEGTLMSGGVLADIAPTMLDMMGLDKPAEMTGHSLLK